jgi:hypothetical protein
MTPRRQLIAAAALIAAAVPLASLTAPAPAEEHKGQEEHQGASPEFMFVQTADDLKADAKTLRLVNVGRQTLYFADRPVRLAGHVPMSDYLNPSLTVAP